ncbi:hypothetical protein ACIP6V_35155 [Streptomyces sp. NPDC088770]|uniref:hypothetical protein n=1 Tax=unclassified Streptomyces TaxID=2593676 RepID=UPI00381A25EE
MEVLVERCGYLPLALLITVALLRADPVLSVAELAEQLADEQGRLALAYDDDAQTLAVKASLELSYRRLPEEQARLFRLLGLHPGPEFSTETAAALAGVRRAGPRSDVPPPGPQSPA